MSSSLIRREPDQAPAYDIRSLEEARREFARFLGRREADEVFREPPKQLAAIQSQALKWVIATRGATLSYEELYMGAEGFLRRIHGDSHSYRAAIDELRERITARYTDDLFGFSEVATTAIARELDKAVIVKREPESFLRTLLRELFA